MGGGRIISVCRIMICGAQVLFSDLKSGESLKFKSFASQSGLQLRHWFPKLQAIGVIRVGEECVRACAIAVFVVYVCGVTSCVVSLGSVDQESKCTGNAMPCMLWRSARNECNG